MNNFTAELAQPAPAWETYLTFSRGDLPGLGANHSNDWMMLTLFDGADPGGEVEIVEVTHHDVGRDYVHCLRGQEGTEARDWPAGTKVECRLTAGTLEGMNALALPLAAAIVDAERVTAINGSVIVGSAFRFTRASGDYFDIFI